MGNPTNEQNPFDALTIAVKTDWVAALRSGNYEQGTGQLRSREAGELTAHCCLGVLGETCGATFYDDWGYLWGEDGQEGQLLSVNTQDRLAGMNDGGSTFSEIADYIEHRIPCVDDLGAGFAYFRRQALLTALLVPRETP